MCMYVAVMRWWEYMIMLQYKYIPASLCERNATKSMLTGQLVIAKDSLDILAVFRSTSEKTVTAAN